VPEDCAVETLCHELGHEPGCADAYAPASRHWLMRGYTVPGRRVAAKAHGTNSLETTAMPEHAPRSPARARSRWSDLVTTARS
jgi:hypothetical protein